jgi:hypothetical protein
MVGSFRRECLDPMLIVNERYLHALLAAFTAYDNLRRPHRALRLNPPVPTAHVPTGLIRRGGPRQRHDLTRRTGR